ncbi:MAG: hypothetical protein DDT39_01300 [Firmicutes bacterium]|nr:hypothetical protein [candidate division NPL-UPA2 bacterium]
MFLEGASLRLYFLGAILYLDYSPGFQGYVQDGLESRRFLVTHVNIEFTNKVLGQPYFTCERNHHTEALISGFAVLFHWLYSSDRPVITVLFSKG